MVASTKTVEKVVEAILKAVPAENIPSLISDLEAIPGNGSFIETIKRLAAALRDKIPEGMGLAERK